MTTQQTVLLIFVLVIGGFAAVAILQGENPAAPGATPERAVEEAIRSPERDPSKWNLAHIGGGITPTRSFMTEKGVFVEVLQEGDKSLPAVNLGRPIDLRVQLYLLNGTLVQNDVKRGLVYGQQVPGLHGLMDGLIDIRPYERRRIRVPNALAHGHRRVANVPPHADLVYDVRWVWFRIERLRGGSGKEAKIGSRVRVMYRGELEDGTIFEQSEAGKPAELVLQSGHVIEGFRVGLRGMKEGGERRLWIPSHMAYGPEPRSKIPAYSNLIFVVELLKVLD